MDSKLLENLLTSVKVGATSVETALGAIKKLGIDDIDFAKIDRHRKLRTGYCEVVYCDGKTCDQVKAIVQRLMENECNIMGTRASENCYNAVRDLTDDIKYHEEARIFVVKPREIKRSASKIAIVTAGTADIPVAEEAAVTAQTMGNVVDRIYDVGVAGLNRLLGRVDQLYEAKVIVVVAGMEGALVSVVGGLVAAPVIAVPTSVGYGTGFGGVAALLTMLNSCSAGVSVVNIDNGFGAGYLASVINNIG